MGHTFVYAPSVEAHIESVGGKVVDVSADISSGSVTRVSNGVSSAQLSIRNYGRKYDGMFDSMCRIVIYLRRVKRLLVFSGYLDMVPAFTAFPGSVRLTASCSLKRLQNWYWDPSTDAAYRLLYLGDVANRSDLTDGGLSKRVIRVLDRVAGWPTSQVHIGAIPNDWFTVVAGVARDIIGEATRLQMISYVGSGAYIAGKNAMEAGSATIQGVGAGTGALPDVIGRLTTYVERLHHLDAHSARPSGPWFLTMRWPYVGQKSDNSYALAPLPGVDANQGRQWWTGRRVLVVNPRNGKAVCLAGCGWGPAEVYLGPVFDKYDSLEAARVGSTSPQALKALGTRDGDDLHLAFAPSGMPVGPVDTSSAATADSGTGTSLSTQLSTAFGKKARAIDFAETAATWCRKHHPYQWGAEASATDPDPAALDCSEMVQWAHMRTGAGSFVDGSRYQYASCTPTSVAEARRTKGALVFVGSSPGTIHHVGVSLGDGTTAEAQSTATGCGIFPFDGQTWNYAGIIPDLDYTGAGGSGAGGTAATGTAQGAPGSASQPSFGEALFNVWQWLGQLDVGGDILGGTRALMNDKPVLQTVEELVTAGMRSYCSAPNGDFIAWFPDYFGHWGTAGKMVIADVEIEEGFAVAKSDNSLRTHWFVTSATSGLEGAGDATQIYQQYSTAGIASVEFPALMRALFKDAGDFKDRGRAFLARYGARPEWEPMDSITGARQEFFFAVNRFSLNWASQWTAPVRLTFMPELWPGMLALFPRYGIQCYAQEVTHSFDLQEGAGFSTEVNGIAWSTMGGSGAGVVRGLPRGASL